MKKITLILFAAFTLYVNCFSQTNILVQAPPGNNATTQVRAPNGNSSHTTMRGCFLVSASELTPYMLPGTNISTFGFTLTSGVTGIPVNGSFTLYLQNTNDVTYSKGTSFSGAITGMSNSYAGNLTIPVSASSTSMGVTLATPFNYTGGGLYVAYDWASSGPFSSTVATYMADNSLALGGASNSTSVAPATDQMGTTNFRPVYLFGAVNTATNDAQVQAIEAPGSVPGILNTSHVIRAVIKNGSNVALSNIPVNLTVTGANPFTASVSVNSLAAGATTTVNFPPYNPQLAGVNTISVHVAPDQLPNNNTQTYTQSVTCNYMGQAPQPATYTNGVGFNTGTGIIAARTVPVANATLTGIRMGISSDAGTAGKQIHMVLMNASGTILASTNTLTINSSNLGTLYTFTFASNQNLTGNTTYFLGMAQPAGAAAFPVGAFPVAQIVPSNLYATTNFTGGAVTTLTNNLGYFSIEGVLLHNTSITAAASSSLVCAESTVNLTASGASTYSWSNNTTGASVIATPTQPTTNYTVIGTTAVGCTASATASINTTPSPTISITSSNSMICSGGSSTLSAAGADTYTWNGTTNNASVAVTPIATTVYTVEGTDNNLGCTSISTVAVTVDTPTLVITGPSSICSGTSAALYGSGAATYTWSAGSTGTAIAVSPSATAIYTLEGSSATGCYGNTTITITVNPSPSVSVVSSSTLLCVGQSATLTASGASVYAWSGSLGSASTAVISPSVTTTYTVTGSNSFNCQKTATVTQVVTSCAGIGEFASDKESIELYPNPTSGKVTIQSMYNLSFEVYSVTGKKLENGVLNGIQDIDLSIEPAGVYFIRFRSGTETVKVIKLIKQ
jgi:hypothetical protein